MTAISRTTTAALGFAACLLIVMRPILASGLDLGFGERGDGIIEIAILEHWRTIITLGGGWTSAFYFHPYANSLGYNDGYLLYGLVYTGWRMFVDPFHADTLNIVTFKTIGFVATYILIASALRWGRRIALLIACLFTVASNVALQAVHAQLQSVALLPVAMILAIALVRAEGEARRVRARLLAVALAALMAAWLLTSYYMAWFTIFSACLFAACWLAMTGLWRPRRLWVFLRFHAGTLVCGGASFLLFIVPFLAVYLPKLHETGGEDYHEMLGYLVTPVIDMINVGPGNYLWGWIFRPLMGLLHAIFPHDPALPGRVLGGEHETGFPLVFFVLIVTGLRKILTAPQYAAGQPPSTELRAFALAMTIAWLLTLQFWTASPWSLVFHLIPGAKGMRVVSRYQIWLTLPFLLIVAAAWRTRLAAIARARPLLAVCIVLLLIAENLSSETAAQLRRSEHRAALAGIAPPPAGCAVFYVTASRRAEPLYMNAYMNARYPHNVDAMLLAELWRTPTINGFSTFNPPDWNFEAPLAADYDLRAMRYAAQHRLHGVCRLDVRRPTPWTRMTVETLPRGLSMRPRDGMPTGW